MKIDFFVGPTWETVRPEMLTGEGCGGSEVALIKMADELGKLGHEITVYGPHIGSYTNVEYVDFNNYNPQNEVDVLVMWRNMAPCYYARPRTKLTVMWLHDLGLPTVPNEIARNIDMVFVVSHFHKESILRTNPGFVNKIEVVFNALNMDLYPDNYPEKQHLKFFYSSSPRRGLTKLLREWPEVRKKFPTAELHVAYGFELSIRMCEKVGNIQELNVYKSMLKSIQKGIDGVVYHGRLNQPELAKLQRSCVAWLYPPSDFEETFCITALEAQAAFCYPISRMNGALPEVISWRELWRSGVHTKDKIADFLNMPLDEVSKELVGNYNWASTFTWERVAQQWETIFNVHAA